MGPTEDRLKVPFYFKIHHVLDFVKQTSNFGNGLRFIGLHDERNQK